MGAPPARVGNYGQPAPGTSTSTVPMAPLRRRMASPGLAAVALIASAVLVACEVAHRAWMAAPARPPRAGLVVALAASAGVAALVGAAATIDVASTIGLRALAVTAVVVMTVVLVRAGGAGSRS